MKRVERVQGGKKGRNRREGKFRFEKSGERRRIRTTSVTAVEHLLLRKGFRKLITLFLALLDEINVKGIR